MWQHLVLREAEDGWGFILKGRVNELGYGAITTPRTLAAFDVALKRFGTRSLRDLLQPAIEYCEEGFQVRPHMANFWNAPPTLGREANITMLTTLPATRKIYVKRDGRVLEVGDAFWFGDRHDPLQSLRCERGHAFESWFQSSAAYEVQEKRKLVNCPVCGSAKVERAIMAPQIVSKKGRDRAEPAPAAPPAPAEASQRPPRRRC